MKFHIKYLLLICVLLAGAYFNSAWADNVTYTFSSKSWAATSGGSAANWTSGKDGYSMQSGRGMQVTEGKSGANATSPTSLPNISQIVVTYSTNASSGAGSIAFQVGSGTAKTKSVTSSGGTSDRTLTYNFSPNETGKVKITVTCTTSSIYIKSVAITYDPSAQSTAPTIGGNASFTISQDVPLTSVSGARIYYTTDGTTPTTSTPTYVTSGESVTIISSCTIKAASKEDGKDLSSVSSKDFTKNLAANAITVTGGNTHNIALTGVGAVEDYSLSASATSGGTVTYALKSATNLVEGTDFEFEAGDFLFYNTYKGIIVVTASVAADDDYTAASQDITINCSGDKRSPVITYDGANTEISNTGSLVIDTDLIESDGDISVESSDTGVATVSEYTISAVADGTTTITINTTEGAYYNAGSGSFELEVVTPSACDIALTGAPVSKTFDVYNNATPQVITYTTSSTGAVNIASNAYASFEIDQVNKKITVTPKSKTPSAQTITINQAATGRYLAGSTTFSLTVNNSATSETYQKVTNAATLAADDEVAIVNEDYGKAAGSKGSEKYLAAVTVSISSNSFSSTSGVETYVLGGTSGAWTLKQKDGSNYLSCNSSSDITNVTSSPCTWAISISEGNASILSSVKASSKNQYIQYNHNGGSNPRFKTYTSSQSPIQLYKKAKYDNVITVTNGLAQTLNLDSETDLTLSATSYCGEVSFAFKSATNLTKDTDFTFDPATGELLVDEDAVSGTITITASTAESATHNAASSDIVISVIGKPVDPDLSGIVDQEVLAGETYTLVNGVDFETDGSVTLSSSNTNVATVSGLVVTAVAVGTTTITVTAAAGTMYKAGSTTFNVTVTAPENKTTISDIVVFNETFDKCSGTGGNGQSFSGTGSTSANYDNDGWTDNYENGANKCLKLGSTSNAGNITTPSITVTSGKTYILTFKCAPWDTETNSVKLTVTGGTINSKTTATTATMTTGQWNEQEYSIVATASTLTLRFEKGGSNNRFFLDEVKIITHPTATVTLNKYGYATYCSDKPIDFSSTSGYTAWRVSSVGGDGTITFNKITEKIKGGQGVLLYNRDADGENTSNVTIHFADGTTEFDSDENLFVGTTAPLYVTDGTYLGLSGYTFVTVTPAGNVPAGKALLPVSAIPAGARDFKFVFEDDETTSITENLELRTENAVYDLQGRKVTKPVKGGLYIVNGKKVIL